MKTYFLLSRTEDPSEILILPWLKVSSHGYIQFLEILSHEVVKKKIFFWGTIRLQFQHCTWVKLRITTTPLTPLHAQPGQWEVQVQRVHATDTVTHKSGPRASWVPIWQHGGYRSVFHLPKLNNSAKARAAWLESAILHSSTYQLELSNH